MHNKTGTMRDMSGPQDRGIENESRAETPRFPETSVPTMQNILHWIETQLTQMPTVALRIDRKVYARTDRISGLCTLTGTGGSIRIEQIAVRLCDQDGTRFGAERVLSEFEIASDFAVTGSRAVQRPFECALPNGMRLTDSSGRSWIEVCARTHRRIELRDSVAFRVGPHREIAALRKAFALIGFHERLLQSDPVNVTHYRLVLSAPGHPSRCVSVEIRLDEATQVLIGSAVYPVRLRRNQLDTVPDGITSRYEFVIPSVRLLLKGERLNPAGALAEVRRLAAAMAIPEENRRTLLRAAAPDRAEASELLRAASGGDRVTQDELLRPAGSVLPPLHDEQSGAG